MVYLLDTNILIYLIRENPIVKTELSNLVQQEWTKLAKKVLFPTKSKKKWEYQQKKV